MFNEPVCHQSCSVYWYIFTHHQQGTMFDALGTHGPPEEFGSPRNWCAHLVQVVCHRMPGEPSGNITILQPKPPLIHPNASLWVCNSSGGRLRKLLHNVTSGCGKCSEGGIISSRFLVLAPLKAPISYNRPTMNIDPVKRLTNSFVAVFEVCI